MGDAKLFRLIGDTVLELKGSSVAVEKSLQALIEAHLDVFLGVRFLATEHTTGKSHRGRIDTLGIDENGCPVIIEYKRALNESVIVQGLFYLDWLMDNKAEYKLLVLEKYGQETADAIDWNAPRLLCIAGDFTKYDEHAVKQIPRNIELIRYRRYGDDLHLLELVVAKTHGQGPGTTDQDKVPPDKPYVLQLFDKCSLPVRDRFETLRSYVLALGDVQERTLKDYVTFRMLKAFANVQFRPQKDCMLVYVNVSPDSIPLEPGFARDMRSQAGTGVWQLELTVDSDEDLDRAKPLILQSFEAS